MITGEEQLYPTTDSNYINNSDPQPTVGLWGGITLKQHMVIEFTKHGFDELPQHVKEEICGESAPHYVSENPFEGTKEITSTYGEPYVQWLLKGRAKFAIMQANEVIKQLNEEQ